MMEMFRWRYDVRGKRDLRIDWLRGLAMTCVIVNHSRISSVLTWFSYERFWIVTAAEMFVALSGVVLGMVYGRRIVRGEWQAVVHGLSRRALTLYGAFVAVTLSVVALGLLGIDVRAVTDSGATMESVCFSHPQTLNAAMVGDIARMRCGPWPFEIVGLYVWLVAAAIPCLMLLRHGRWRWLLALSWSLYLLHRLRPYSLTGGAFETEFPILAWQLLFVHGLTIGYHAENVRACALRCPRAVPIAIGGAAAAFAVLAACNPWSEGPSALHWTIVSPEHFTALYFRHFSLRDLGAGRLLNIAVALPTGYALLTRFWGMVRPIGALFVTLGQQSLGAFVLHVYGILILSHLALKADAFWTATVVQMVLVCSIAGVLHGMQQWRSRQRRPTLPQPQPQRLAA